MAPPVSSATTLRFRLRAGGVGQDSATDEVSVVVNNVSSGGGSSSSGGGSSGGSGGGGALDALTAALMFALSCAAGWRSRRLRS
jgi:hypothetical protein